MRNKHWIVYFPLKHLSKIKYILHSYIHMDINEPQQSLCTLHFTFICLLSFRPPPRGSPPVMLLRAIPSSLQCQFTKAPLYSFHTASPLPESGLCSDHYSITGICSHQWLPYSHSKGVSASRSLREPCKPNTADHRLSELFFLDLQFSDKINKSVFAPHLWHSATGLLCLYPFPQPPCWRLSLPRSH